MRIPLAALLMILLAASAAQAQFFTGGWDGGYHSSTYEEGVQRGFADFVRSAGQAQLLNSEATKNYEDARKKYLENRLLATQTYFDARRMNQEARRSERSPPLSMEAYARLARQQAPDRLSVSQLDPLTGTITWPQPLLRPDYQAEREELERLYRERAGGVAHNYEAILLSTDKFQERLKTDLQKFDPNEFIRAKNFLDSLAYEPKVAQR
jgi:hypothetical protein